MPGRRFNPTHEIALHDDALSACQSLPGAARGLLVVAEMVGPIGIPDLTALVGDRSILEQRLAINVPPLTNQIDAAIVGVTNARAPKSIDAVASALGWPMETINRRIPSLVRIGALIPMSRDRFRRPPEIRPLGRLYAIEAKVKDRGAAVQQARAYNTWADSYVLVMGALSERVLRLLLADVAADRGGLIVDGRWMRRPAIKTHHVARRLWAAEHLVAAIGERHQPSVVP